MSNDSDARTVRPGHRVTYHNEQATKQPVAVGERYAVDVVIRQFTRLTDEERLQVIAECCHYCGALDPACRCGDDS